MRFPVIGLNSDRIFTRGVASSGCEVYVPVQAVSGEQQQDQLIQKTKAQLQSYLDSQEPWTPPPVRMA